MCGMHFSVFLEIILNGKYSKHRSTQLQDAIKCYLARMQIAAWI
jgi:hypothetical protein